MFLVIFYSLNCEMNVIQEEQKRMFSTLNLVSTVSVRSGLNNDRFEFYK